MKRAEEQHYCRHCEQAFEPAPDTTPSAHMRYILHTTADHPNMGEEPRIFENSRGRVAIHRSCDRHCLGHEQPDERQHGVRLYGPGATRMSEVVPLIMTADQIFPIENEDG